jgi:hypothetical protein
MLVVGLIDCRGLILLQTETPSIQKPVFWPSKRIKPFQSFPTDVFRIILDVYVADCEASSSRKGIVTLMKTCRLMRTLLEPILYTCVVLSSFESLQRFPKAFRTARKHTKSIVITSLRRVSQEGRIIRSILVLLYNQVTSLCMPPNYRTAFCLMAPISYVHDLTFYYDQYLQTGPFRCRRLRMALYSLHHEDTLKQNDWHSVVNCYCPDDYAFEVFPHDDTTVDLESLLLTSGIDRHCARLRFCVGVIYLPNERDINRYRHAYRAMWSQEIHPRASSGNALQRFRVAFLLREEFENWSVLSLESRGENFWDKIATRLEP